MPHKTWAVGEEVIAADFAANVADQIVATYASSAARAAGWPAPPVGAISTLADSGTIDRYDGAAWVPVAGRRIGASFRRAAAGFSVPNAVATTVPMDTALSDPMGFLVGGAVTVPAGMGGVYVVSAVVRFPSAFWVIPHVILAVGNNAFAVSDANWMRAGTAWEATIPVTREVALAAGNVVNLRVWHNSGGAATLAVDAAPDGSIRAYTPALSLYRVSP